jgi:tRNA dimethylallyltransferase
MFFLRALQQPLFDEPPLDDVRRERLRAFLNALPVHELRAWAETVHPGAALPSDRQRLARLIEVVTLTGRRLSDWHAASPPQPAVPTLTFVMSLPRDELYRRINDRVHQMVAHGFVQEVQGLVAQGYGREDPGMNATGYAEVLEHVIGTLPLADAITLTQAATRRYARRQLTWIRTQLGPDVYELDARLPLRQLVDDVVAVWQKGLA